MNTQTSYFKKALVVLMAVMMVFTMMPGMAWAADGTETSSNESSEGNIVARGTCGATSNAGGAASVTWTLTSDGVLKISGNGDMEDYRMYGPWYQKRNVVTVVMIEDGVTSLGQRAFYLCKNMQTIQLPTSLTKIGAFAFSTCSNLKEIELPETLTTIEANAFAKCTSLCSISIPDSVTNLGKQAFIDCTELKSVRFGKGLAGMEEGAPSIFFSKCSKLEKFVFPKEITAYPILWGSGHSKAVLICYTGTEEEWNKVSFVEADKKALKDAFMVYNYKEGESGKTEIFTRQPQNAAYIQGDEAQPLTAAIGPAKEGTEYHFQWYKNSVGSTEDATAVWGSETSGLTSTYIPGTGAENIGTTYYFCRVYSVKNGVLAETDSSTASVTVTKATFNFKGEGSEENPWLIQSDDDMAMLKRLVNGGESMKNKYFKMTADITLPANWTPIGRTKTGSADIDKGNNLNAFSGTLDGDNHKLTVPKGEKPLLGYVNGATVKNLKIYGEEINGYGLVNNFEGVGLSGSAIVIDNVKILEGTKTKKAGFLGGNITTNPFAGNSAGFTATIRNCEIEKGVTIGYDKDERMIGSFAGRMQGTIENCVSAADVYGADYVGGIIGTRDNAMGLCEVKNCTFSGSVNGSGKNTGGIVGGGYENSTAPNGVKVSIVCCNVDGMVNGNINVGGIIGADEYVAQSWGAYTFVGNTFSGKITGSENVGGIIGFYDSLNKFDNIAGNFYTKNCGATSGIGAVKYVDTNYKNPTKVTGTTYFNTEKGVSECPEVKGCNWKAAHNRTDDPLGADKEKLTKAVDSIPTEAFAYELVLKSGNVETEYLVGNAFDFGDAVFAAKMTDGTEKLINKKDIKVSGYNANSHTVQTVMLTYGYAQMEVQVAVKLDSTVVKKDKLSVGFTLLGESKHDSDTDKKVHGLAMGGLTPWTSGKYEVDLNATVWDLMQQVQQNNSNITFKARGSQYGTYVYAVTYNSTTLGELDNGKLSGWMYTVNGTHPEVGVGSRFLNDGDTVVFHYTDDYTKEEGSEKWNTPGGAEEEVKDVTTAGAAGSVTTKAPTDVKVSQKTNADGTKETVADVKVAAEHQDEIIKQAAEKKSAEIILEVSAANTKGADSVQMELDVKFVKNISDKTDADLTVNTENGKVTLDQETIKTVLAEAKGATITLEVTKVSKPTDVQKKAAGANGHLLKLTIKSGDKVISDFNKGKVKVVAEIVSKLLDKKVAAIHIADDGKIEQLAGKVLTIGGKKYYEFTTPHFSTFALVDAEELGLEVKEEPAVDVKTLTAKLTPVARSAKTAKKNVKVTVSLAKQDKAIVQELKDAGYTVKYRFYRSTKKAAGYKAAVTKKTSTYTNTSGKKGTKYYYKVQIRVYDADGKLAAKTAIKQCKYASRIWTR